MKWYEKLMIFLAILGVVGVGINEAKSAPTDAPQAIPCATATYPEALRNLKGRYNEVPVMRGDLHHGQTFFIITADMERAPHGWTLLEVDTNGCAKKVGEGTELDILPAGMGREVKK